MLADERRHQLIIAQARLTTSADRITHTRASEAQLLADDSRILRAEAAQTRRAHLCAAATVRVLACELEVAETLAQPHYRAQTARLLADA